MTPISKPLITLRALADRAGNEPHAALLTELGPFCLVGPAGHASQAAAFRYATAHSLDEDAGPSPLVSLLDSIVLPLIKRPGAAFPNLLLVGRASTSDLIVDDGSVSKLHARITINEGTPQLTDAGSTNGTFLDGERLRHAMPVELRAGQSLRFGDREFKVREPAALLARVVAFRALPE